MMVTLVFNLEPPVTCSSLSKSLQEGEWAFVTEI
jgi:hypothetical protein